MEGSDREKFHAMAAALEKKMEEIEKNHSAGQPNNLRTLAEKCERQLEELERHASDSIELHDKATGILSRLDLLEKSVGEPEPQAASQLQEKAADILSRLDVIEKAVGAGEVQPASQQVSASLAKKLNEANDIAKGLETRLSKIDQASTLRSQLEKNATQLEQRVGELEGVVRGVKKGETISPEQRGSDEENMEPSRTNSTKIAVTHLGERHKVVKARLQKLADTYSLPSVGSAGDDLHSMPEPLKSMWKRHEDISFGLEALERGQNAEEEIGHHTKHDLWSKVKKHESEVAAMREAHAKNISDLERELTESRSLAAQKSQPTQQPVPREVPPVASEKSDEELKQKHQQEIGKLRSEKQEEISKLQSEKQEEISKLQGENEQLRRDLQNANQQAEQQAEQQAPPEAPGRIKELENSNADLTSKLRDLQNKLASQSVPQEPPRSDESEQLKQASLVSEQQRQQIGQLFNENEILKGNLQKANEEAKQQALICQKETQDISQLQNLHRELQGKTEELRTKDSQIDGLNSQLTQAQADLRDAVSQLNKAQTVDARTNPGEANSDLVKSLRDEIDSKDEQCKEQSLKIASLETQLKNMQEQKSPTTVPAQMEMQRLLDLENQFAELTEYTRAPKELQQKKFEVEELPQITPEIRVGGQITPLSGGVPTASSTMRVAQPFSHSMGISKSSRSVSPVFLTRSPQAAAETRNPQTISPATSYSIRSDLGTANAPSTIPVIAYSSLPAANQTSPVIGPAREVGVVIPSKSAGAQMSGGGTPGGSVATSMPQNGGSIVQQAPRSGGSGKTSMPARITSQGQQQPSYPKTIRPFSSAGVPKTTYASRPAGLRTNSNFGAPAGGPSRKNPGSPAGANSLYQA